MSDVTFFPSNGCNSYTGYGRYEVGLAQGLSEAGARLHLHADPARPTVIVGFAEWLEAPHVAGTKRWLATLTESTAVSEAWVEIINREAAGVLLPTQSLCDVYRASGVTVPLIDIGYAVDGIGAPAAHRPAAEKFRFLTYSYGDMRKGADIAVGAFHAVFGGDMRYELVVKARDGYEGTWLRAIDGITPQIRVVAGQQSGAAWDDLLRSAHCFVFPSRAEGIGLPPREAVLMHIPTIATAWLGMDDAAHWSYPLRVADLWPAAYEAWNANREGALWAQPDFEQLKTLLRAVADDYNAAYMHAVAGAAYLKAKTWRAVGERIMAALAGVMEDTYVAAA